MTWDSKAHWQATELVAKRLASFRLGLDADDPYSYNEHEKLQAGIIIGTLGANGWLPRIFPDGEQTRPTDNADT